METFDNFHKSSARIIRTSVFGVDGGSGRVRDEYRFASNNLVITNVDIQSVEPVDASTRDSLQKSVQMAIEITINSQEARAKHEATREAEEAKGMLHQQQLQNKAAAERHKRELLELRAESSAIESSGVAKAEAAAVEHRRAMDALELQKQRETAAIEAERFAAVVGAIGPETIAAIARAGPEMQAKLLGVLVTDGKSPVNLLSTAQGLVGGGALGGALG